MASQLSNPFASPQTASKTRNSKASKSQQTESLRLFSDRQIGVSAFLGTPLAGALMFAYNADKLGRKGQAAGAIIASLALTAALVLVGTVMPGPLSQLPLIGVALGMKYWAGTTFKEQLESRRESGSGWQSNWTAFGVAVAAVIVVVPVVLALAFALL